MTVSPTRERSDIPRLGLGVTLDARHTAFRDELRAWLAANVPTDPEPADERERFAFRRTWQRRLADAGWAAPSWPVEYGGRGSSALEQFLYSEELAWAGAPALADTPGLLLLGPTLMVHGADLLKEQFLPRILRAEDIWCQGFSEPASGSDLASVTTTATLVDEQWVIDGGKIWTSFAPYADYCFVLCRTAPPEGERRHSGLSLVIVPIDQPGVVVNPIRQPSEEHEFAQVFFRKAVAPAEWVVGEPGNGWRVCMTLLEFERADQGFTDHARLLVMLREIRDLVDARVSEGSLVGNDLVLVRKRFEDAWARCHLLCQFNLARALARDTGQQPGSWGSFMKLYWSETWQAVAELGFDCAGDGATGARDWVLEFFRSRAATIYSGTSEIQRNVIGDRVLGLPR